MTGGETEEERKNFFKQGDLHFHSVLGPTHYVAGPAFHFYGTLTPLPWPGGSRGHPQASAERDTTGSETVTA